MDRPLCKCHGEPMHRNGHEPNGHQKYRCSIIGRERSRVNYDAMSGVDYARKLLGLRRQKALARRKRREEIGGSLP